MWGHGLIERIPNHGNVLLSRGRLISVEAPRHPGHPSSIQLDFFCMLFLYSLMYMLITKKKSFCPQKKNLLLQQYLSRIKKTNEQNNKQASQTSE